MTPELIAKRKKWYSSKVVQYNLIGAMKYREVIFMKLDDYSHCIRGIQISNTQALNYYFDKFDFFNKNYNIYVSVSKYTNIPKFTLNLKERSKETNRWFSEQAHVERFNYDILLDLDFNEKIDYWLVFLSKCNKMINLVNNYKIAYTIYPSGTGIQIVVYNPNFGEFGIDRVKKITTRLKKRFAIPYLCLNTIGQTTKIRKCEYSLVYDRVCLPLNDINTFSYSDIDSNTVLRTQHLYNRGLLIHNIFNCNESQYLKNMLKTNLIEDE